MEFVEIVEITEDAIKARYYPEQSAPIGEYGAVTYFCKKDDWVFDKLPEGYLTNYAIHAVNFIRNYKYKNARKSGMVAWY